MVSLRLRSRREQEEEELTWARKWSKTRPERKRKVKKRYPVHRALLLASQAPPWCCPPSEAPTEGENTHPIATCRRVCEERKLKLDIVCHPVAARLRHGSKSSSPRGVSLNMRGNNRWVCLSDVIHLEMMNVSSLFFSLPAGGAVLPNTSQSSFLQRHFALIAAFCIFSAFFWILFWTFFPVNEDFRRLLSTQQANKTF